MRVCVGGTSAYGYLIKYFYDTCAYLTYTTLLNKVILVLDAVSMYV